MRRLFALLLVLMLALPAAAAPCAPAPAATHHAMPPASHDAPAGCAERLHGCIGCAVALRTPDLTPSQSPDAAAFWVSWTPAAPAGLAAIPAIPPPRLG